MKIALVCRVVPAHRPGGMPFCLEDRAEELARQGHEVHVLTTGISDIKIPSGKIPNYHIHFLKCPPEQYTADFANELTKKCKELQPDILHLDSFDRERLWWKERPGDPKTIGITMHGNGMGAFLTQWNQFRESRGPFPVPSDLVKVKREAEALKLADVTIAISRSEQLQMVDHLGLSNVHLVYNPIAPYFFDRPTVQRNPNGPIICAAISGHNTRGFDVAKAVGQKLNRPVKILKDIPRERMVDEYDACSAVLLPTHYAQGFDLVCAEAAARERPVFASATGSYFMEDGTDEDAYNPYLTAVVDRTVNGFAEAISNWDGSGHYAFFQYQPKAHVERWLEAMDR